MIVRTKLNRPPPPPDLVPRERLATLLQSNPDRSLTLVSAPAGYGKSTLVSRWLDIVDESGVWLSLDEEDNELRFFLNYFIEAVRMHSPKACRRTHDLLGTAEPELNRPSSSSIVLVLLHTHQGRGGETRRRNEDEKDPT